MDNKKTKESKENQKKRERGKKKNDKFWVLKVFLFSLVMTVVISLLSQEVITALNVIPALIVLVLIILVGIVFDIIGLAVATADEKPFHSMAARRIREGRKAISLIQNADKVSNVCNDVIGDIAGVVSGATGSAIVLRMALSPNTDLLVSLLVTGFISAVTVGGKAAGKSVAINKSHDIVYMISRFLCFFEKRDKRK